VKHNAGVLKTNKDWT